MGIVKRRRNPSRIYTVLKQKCNKEPNKTYVLFEGPTDRALWSGYVGPRCELVRAYNKEGAVAILRRVNKEEPSWRNVAAIIDPDYWLIEQSDKLNTPNLLYDDAPDLEMMLLNSPTLEKVFRNTLTQVDSDAIPEFTNIVRDESKRLGAEFGFYRLIDFRNRQFNLSFNAVSFEDVIDVADEKFNHELVAELLVQGSKLRAAELMDLVSHLRLFYSYNPEMCRGKDVLSLISIVLPVVYKETFCKDLSGKSKIQTRSNELSRTLRMAYEFVYFITTQLYKRIRAWECANKGKYLILNPEI